MMLVLILLFALYEGWRARRALAAHIETTAGAQTAAAEMATQFEREQFARHSR